MQVTIGHSSLKLFRMNQRARYKAPANAARWARRLNARVEEILARHPNADRDNVRHALILLELPPLERLQRSLIRGRAIRFINKPRNKEVKK